MANITFVYEGNDNRELFELCARLLEARGHKCYVSLYTQQTSDKIIYSRIKKIDLLVCSNLTASDRTTLTKENALNLAKCKVYQLITKESCKCEHVLLGMISIGHFFFCVKKRRYEDMKKKYKNIYTLELLEGWGEDLAENGVRLADSIENVLKRCFIV